MIEQKDIEGTWKLKSFKIAKNGILEDWRENAHGILIYSSEGYMSVAINSDSKNEDFFDSLLFYSGTYVLEQNLIRHKVLNATSASRIGQDLLRTAELTTRRLKLTAAGEFGTAVLDWEKIC